MEKRMNYQYYVEGEDEKNLLNVLKREFQCIESGRVDKFNAIQERFTVLRIRPLRQNTVVVLVYDTDVAKTDILRQNIDFLKDQSAIKKVLCVPQVKNLEEELLRSCQIRKIEELTGSCTKKDYKREFIQCTNLGARLKQYGFDIANFWSSIPAEPFHVFGNDSAGIKLPKSKFRQTR